MLLVQPSFEILTAIDGPVILRKIEMAGRTCYKSKTPDSLGKTYSFVRNLIENGHHSVIEHENLSVRFICDRGVSHEIVRHRLAAYSQESTRYCNYSGGVTFVIPPWVGISPGEYTTFDLADYGNDGTWYSAMINSEMRYLQLLQDGWSPQQARSVLPNSLKTELVMTANIREWRHVLKLRTATAAHPQMRELMLPLLLSLSDLVPVLFDDIVKGV
jgi:thymidylate synthase (FAD)